MAIIVTDCDFRDECKTCLFSDENDYLCERTLGYLKATGKREDCPIKTVEGLIDAIHKKANSGQWNEAVVFGMDLAIKVIKDYCEVSE